MATEALQSIDTHSAGDDSEGVIWGIRFELLGISLGGVALGGVLMACLIWKQYSLLASSIAGATPALLSIGYVAFRQTHPPGFDSDLIDLGISGRGFGPRPAPAGASDREEKEPS